MKKLALCGLPPDLRGREFSRPRRKKMEKLDSELKKRVERSGRIKLTEVCFHLPPSAQDLSFQGDHSCLSF